MNSSAFVAALRHFSADPSDLATLRSAVVRRIVEGPVLAGSIGDGNVDVVESAELDAAMYLDFVLDDGPEHSLEEARDLAAAALALLESFAKSDHFLCDLLQLARWRRATVERTRAYLAGEASSDAYTRFIERRPWPPSVVHVWLAVPDEQLSPLAAALLADEWTTVRAILAAA